jgi:cytochrome P450
MRKALQAHTFSDGTHVPAGTMIASPTWPQHLDEDSYASADTLDPFRFKPTMPEDADADAKGPRRQFTTTDLSYIPFGHGRHACPGRFFAGAELKAMFVHVLLTYDVRTVEPGVRPKDLAMAQSALPNPTARVLFRKRQ